MQRTISRNQLPSRGGSRNEPKSRMQKKLKAEIRKNLGLSQPTLFFWR